MSPEKSQGTGGSSAGAGPLTETPSKGVSKSDTPTTSTGSTSSPSGPSAPRNGAGAARPSPAGPRTAATPVTGTSPRSSGESVAPPRRPESAATRPTAPTASATRPEPPTQGPARTSSATTPRVEEPTSLVDDDGDGVRTVRLTVANVDPMSVLKLSFLVAVAAGIVLVVAVMVLWMVLDGMGVFADINRVLGDIGGEESSFNIYSYIGFGKVTSIALVIAIINVFIITALSTIASFLYNFGSGLVGGLQVTLSDD